MPSTLTIRLHHFHTPRRPSQSYPSWCQPQYYYHIVPLRPRPQPIHQRSTITHFIQVGFRQSTLSYWLATIKAVGKTDRRIFLILHYVPKGLLNQRWNNFGEQRRAKFETWICIDLNEPRLELLINHKIHS